MHIAFMCDCARPSTDPSTAFGGGGARETEDVIATHSARARATGGGNPNAATDEYTNLIKAGVIDPVKVVRTALQNAASVASMMLTTECLVAERPKDEKLSGGGGGHAGHGHGDF